MLSVIDKYKEKMDQSNKEKTKNYYDFCYLLCDL